jgi:hypothetical protein
VSPELLVLVVLERCLHDLTMGMLQEITYYYMGDVNYM